MDEQGAIETEERAAGGEPLAEAAERAGELGRRLKESLAHAVVGRESEIEQALVALLAGGHVLLEGPPGVAKTLLVRALATALDLSHGRIQFTPDLMPTDVVGTSIWRPSEGAFRFQAGPIFAQLVLCDEINRAPPKTQAALLEAMQEGAATVDGVRHPCPVPFTVFATQNPIEYEGTYPLPEAQLDRFLVRIELGYPDAATETRLLAQAHGHAPLATPAELGVTAVCDAEELVALRAAALAVRVREDLCAYVVRLLAATRAEASFVLGASPRAGVLLLRAAKARALLLGRGFVTPDDVKAVFRPALRHRVMLDPAYEVEGGRADDALARVLDSVEVPR